VKFFRTAVGVLLGIDISGLGKLTRRKSRKAEKGLAAINSMPRPLRNYDQIEVQRGQTLAAESRGYLDAIRKIGLDDNDAVIQSYIRGIGLALASERPFDFTALYDQMLESDLPDTAKDLIASATLDMMAAELTIVEMTA